MLENYLGKNGIFSKNVLSFSWELSRSSLFESLRACLIVLYCFYKILMLLKQGGFLNTGFYFRKLARKFV